ncbi:hypothetical protein [Aquimarina algicola]|uniref:Uncharacterized protein n=1 Tax=Aquimarina algicola TaxID=2589995 RepID=A0A504J804_9FLAO|nr:hypothetical protein [Aquimarina algicola]TPN82301.1 hypothetical protein FHK87_23030 [Aquimarina algicola]
MKNFTFIMVVMGLITTSCTNTKDIVENEFSDDIEVADHQTVLEYPLEITDSKTTEKILTIILEYTNEPLSSIALSRIFLTEEFQYNWKFLNVKTGERYTAEASGIFDNVKILKTKLN